MTENVELLKERFAKHKALYDLAVDADNPKEIKKQAEEMRNIKTMIINFSA